MAVPKKKTSKQRRDSRRATHHIAGPTVGECPQCHAPRLPHRVCPKCGMYRGRQVVSLEE
ncbi:MAG: 50S ribosomal protein L32 [Actinobacteria bacterium]|nr:50S ribosomal protein L32 [Actinomycetota bacterium]